LPASYYTSGRAAPADEDGKNATEIEFYDGPEESID
jgi:hypothetical protein